MIPSISAVSRTVRVIGPSGPFDHDSGIAPGRLTRPYVALRPTMPQHAAGRRTEPPVSLPSAPRQSPLATAAPDPLDDPPDTWPVCHGLSTSPWCGLSPNGPIASSVMLSLPSVMAPAATRRADAVQSCSATKYSRVFVPHEVGQPRRWQRSLSPSGTP